MKNFNYLVQEELQKARNKHGPMTNLHEAYAVILEEVDELWEHCRKKQENRNPQEILEELVQISAMAQKTAEDVIMPLIVKENKMVE